MTRWIFSAALVLSIGITSWAAAASPTETASGAFLIRSPAALFVFRVAPWSEGIQQIRGLGRVTIEADEPADVYFEILGTYRPGAAHETGGVLVYHGLETQAVPWRGGYDAKQGRFQWTATVGERKLPLPSMTAHDATAAAKPARATGMFAKFKVAKADELHGKDGELDFGKIITLVAEHLPDSPTPPQAPTAPANPASEPTPSTDDILIIQAITDMGAGKEQSGGGVRPKDILKHVLGNKDNAVRKRREYPPLDPPRVVKTLTKPGPAAPDSTTPVPAASTLTVPQSPLKMVPNVVGTKFEDAVNVLFSAGLYPNSVDCLGPAKDPAQAERVVSQTPAAGAPFPVDGNVRLKWYAPLERPPGLADGFQATDGPKVDLRFVESKIAANGRAIGKSVIAPKEVCAWSIVKMDEPSLQASMKDTRANLAKLMAEVKGSDVVVVDVTVRRDNPGDVAFEYSSHPVFNGAEYETTYHHRIVEYRGFVIGYYHNRKGLNQPLSAISDTVLENSRRLIDLRFPK
jgi:hypothetical protein